MWRHWVLLGAHRLSLSSKIIGHALRTTLRCSQSSLVSTWRSASRGVQRKARGGNRRDSARCRAARGEQRKAPGCERGTAQGAELREWHVFEYKYSVNNL
eukprot:614117-Pleurochrysis_carterae.AAC.1